MAYLLYTHYPNSDHVLNEKARASNTALSNLGQGVPSRSAIKGESETDSLPLEVVHLHTGKYLNWSAYGTFYFRLITSKVDFDFGIITGERGEVFTIFNGFDTPVVLQSYVVDNLDGVSIVPLDGVLPLTINQYSSARMQMVLSPQGSATLNGTSTFNFSNGDSITIKVRGSRLILLNVPPNWAKNLTEVFEYRTNVLTSFNGKEQRRSLTNIPRRKMSYTGVIQRDNLAKFRNKLHRWHDRGFMTPLWYQRSSLLETVELGAKKIRIANPEYDFVVGGSIVIWKTHQISEVFEIVTIEQGDTLTLNSPTSYEFSKGDMVFPAMMMRLENTVKLDNLNGVVGESELHLVSDNNTKLPMPIVDNNPSYMGHEVLLKKPNWNSQISDEFTNVVGEVDYGYGRREWFPRDVPSMPVREQTHLIRDYAELLWWKAFIQRRKGQFKSFYTPSWTQDIQVANKYASGSEFLDVRDDHLTTLLAKEQDRKHLYIELNGKVYFAEIKEVSYHNGNARLTIDPPLNQTAEPDSFGKVCYLQRFRLGGDEISFTYHAHDKVELTLNMKQILETGN